jgi:mannose-6-phosphate isomerase-like protein (cupin superfamily)
MADRVYRFETAGFNWTIAHEGNAEVAVSRVLCTHAINWIDLVRIPPGHGIGLHTHGTDDEEIYIIVDGTGTMTVEDHSLPVGPGDVAHNPVGGTHGLLNSGSVEMRLVVVGVPAAQGGRHDIE